MAENKVVALAGARPSSRRGGTSGGVGGGVVKNIERPPRKQKERSTNEIKNIGVTELHGKFMRALRRRVGLTCEILAEKLNYKRPTQIIRMEAGFMSAPMSEIDTLSKLYRCNKKILLLARIMAFEAPIYDEFGEALCRAIGLKGGKIRPADFFRSEISGLEKKDGSELWHGAHML